MASSQKLSSTAKFIALIVVLVGLLAGGFYFFDPLAKLRPAAYDGPRESLTLALGREPLAALAIVALDRKFFEAAGVDVAVKRYNSGALALKGFLAAEADVATTADIPIAFESLSRRDFSIVATIGSSDNEPRIVARKDHGVGAPSDLRGKRVATQKASAVHFFLHMFLLQNGMTTADVQLSYLKPNELVKALLDGEIDAFSMREPFVSQALQPLGDKAVVFMQPGLYRKTFNVVVHNDLLQRKPQAVQRFLRALAQAEAFAQQQPQAAKAIVAAGLEAKPEQVDELWRESNLTVSLDQSLLVGLEDEAKWIVEAKLSDVTEPPSYLDLIYVNALKTINPVMVSLIH